MALVIGGILALLGIAVAVYPFVRRRFSGRLGGSESAAVDSEPGADAALAEAELSEIYRAISTLRLERELGNVPEGLYREQLNGYRQRAARALRAGELAPGDDQDRALEEEIRVARWGQYRAAAGGSTCINCARPLLDGVSECPECGAAISRPHAGRWPPSGSGETEL